MWVDGCCGAASFHQDLGLMCRIDSLQILKSEKRNDGVWYYLIHYSVSPLRHPGVTHLAKTGAGMTCMHLLESGYGF
jgi:hypothetical protein